MLAKSPGSSLLAVLIGDGLHYGEQVLGPVIDFPHEELELALAPFACRDEVTEIASMGLPDSPRTGDAMASQNHRLPLGFSISISK